MSSRLPAIFILCCALSPLQSWSFQTGQRVWIDLAAVNINDDSYAEGEIIQDSGTDKVQVMVKSITQSKAFSSGVFCAAPSQQSNGWESPAVYNVITNQAQTFPRHQLMDWTAGYNRFYERQNWLHTFLKWLDRHPVIERNQILEAGKKAQDRSMNDLTAVNQLMLAEYDAYQTAQFRFYPIAERLAKLTPVLASIQQLLQRSTELRSAWQPLKRDPVKLNHSSYTLFMTEAIDKIIQDAHKSRRLLTTPVDETIHAFDQQLSELKRTP